MIGRDFIRMIVLLGQCSSQLERSQQAVRFHDQWQALLKIVQGSFENYQRQLMEIRQEQDSFIHLDAIQVPNETFDFDIDFFPCLQDIQQLRLQCEQNFKQLETLTTTGIIHSNKKEVIRTQTR